MAEEFDKGDKVRRIERNLDRPEAALKQIGALAIAESQLAFREQKLGDTEWRERGVPNIMGIIADFAAGKTPPERRFEARPALRDTGRLAASITARVVSDSSVEVGSNLPYAPVQHFGGKVESAPLTDQIRRLIGDWLKGKGKQHRRSVGWLLNKKYRGKSITTTVPARPIVAITKTLMEDAIEVVGVKIVEAEK